jgi:hypothetical protein
MLANSNWKAWFKSQKLQNIFHIKCHVQNIWISKNILWICEQYVIFVILHLCPCKNLWNEITKTPIFENQWISEKKMISNDKIINMSKSKVKIMSFQVCLKKLREKKKIKLGNAIYVSLSTLCLQTNLKLTSDQQQGWWWLGNFEDD